MARTLGQAAVEGMAEKICVREGEDRLNAVRDQAKALAPALSLEAEFARLDVVVGAILGTRDAALLTGPSKARAAGAPYDPDCLDRLAVLRRHLESVALPEVADTASTPGAREALSFVEAYFSNYIEGTRFLVEEAKTIVFEGRSPAGRPKDGRDVLETYKQTAALGPRPPLGLTYAEFRDEIRSRHADLMAARPEIGPGWS